MLTIDFRTKLFMSATLSFTLLMGNLQQRYLIVAFTASALPYLLMFCSKQYKDCFKGLSFVLLATVIQKYYLYETKGFLSFFFLFLAMLSLRLLPGLMMGKYTLATTSMSDLVYCLKKLRLPDQVVIPITVMARFFYTVKEDYGQIKDAMYLNGLTTRRLLFKPLKLFEYRFVPLLMCLIRTSNEVAISAMTRGMSIGGEKSSISNAHFSLIDIFLFGLMFTLIGFFIKGKYA